MAFTFVSQAWVTACCANSEGIGYLWGTGISSPGAGGLPAAPAEAKATNLVRTSKTVQMLCPLSAPCVGRRTAVGAWLLRVGSGYQQQHPLEEKASLVINVSPPPPRSSSYTVGRHWGTVLERCFLSPLWQSRRCHFGAVLSLWSYHLRLE